LVTQTLQTKVQTIQQQLALVQSWVSSPTNKISQASIYSASESLLQKELINTLVSHFIVLLIQKRKSEAKDVRDQLNEWIRSNVDLDDDVNEYVLTQRQASEGCVLIVRNHSKQGPQFVSFAQNVLPMYQDLFVSRE
jgi:hypothetical protein